MINVRDCSKITFITLNRLCLISVNPPTPCSLQTIHISGKLDGIYQAKLNEKYMPVLQGISNYEGTSYKKLQDIASSFFISCCLTSIFTSEEDIIFTTFQNLIQNYLRDSRNSRSLMPTIHYA